MRTKKYWDNRYTDFINEVLGFQIIKHEEYAGYIKEEREICISHYLPMIKEDTTRAKMVVLFLYVNHQLNLLDPIGFYPEVLNEYESYAKKMVDRFLQEESKESLSKKIEIEMVEMWSAIASNPETDKKKINKGVSEIIKKVYIALMEQKERNGANFSEEKYWLAQLNAYMAILVSERMNYYSKAVLFQEEYELLLEEKEDKFKEFASRLDEYIYFLYVNHQLNLLDPTGQYYPGLTYPHEEYAWKIVEAFKTEEKDQFQITIETVISRLFKELGVDSQNNKSKINTVIDRIQRQLLKLNR